LGTLDIVTNPPGNNIYFQESFNETLLQRATYEVQSLIQDSSFSAEALILVTWFRVAEYADPAEIDPLSTWQVIIAYNETSTYLTYLFGALRWSDDDLNFAYSGFKRISTLTNTTTDSLIINRSGTEQAATIASQSNVGVQGQFMFKVDSPVGFVNVTGELILPPNSPSSSISSTPSIIPSSYTSDPNEQSPFPRPPIAVISPNLLESLNSFSPSRLECHFLTLFLFIIILLYIY